jgi:rhamnogalacturonyl hydrolase YesR
MTGPLRAGQLRFDPATLDDKGREIYNSLRAVEAWVENHHYKAYEPFDGLSSPLRRLACGNLLLERLLMQAVRQSPINIRPLVGIKPLPSTKGRGYMAAAYLTLYRTTGDATYRTRAIECLDWLRGHRSSKFHEYSWANHFDFASRGGRYSKDESIIVWTALIGHAFIDGYECTRIPQYLGVAESACRWILGLPRERTDSGTCLSYHAIGQSSIHNANMLGAGFLARMWQLTGNPQYRTVAAAAMEYSCSRQRPDGAWWYAEDPKFHWIDGFHTGYNLDSLKHYISATGDETYTAAMMKGLDYYKRHFFGEDGCPAYYHNRVQPIDSQCAAQAIETLANFAAADPDSLELARRVALWTIRNMQDPDGHFYYRFYPFMKAKAPMLHWAQATTYRGLALLLSRLAAAEPATRKN